MKKYFLLLSLLIIGFASCKKTATFDAAKQAATDDANIQTYIAANNINATKDPSGLYYQVITQGTGGNPTVNSKVSVNYTGKLLSGTVFEQGSLNAYALAGLIEGWKIGIPYVKSGGRILLIIPSALAYGNRASDKVPANSPLVFTIDLLSFSN